MISAAHPGVYRVRANGSQCWYVRGARVPIHPAGADGWLFVLSSCWLFRCDDGSKDNGDCDPGEAFELIEARNDVTMRHPCPTCQAPIGAPCVQGRARTPMTQRSHFNRVMLASQETDD